MIRRARPWLGTIVEIGADNLAAVEAGFAAIAHVHARMSFHEATSDLAALRQAKTGVAVEVDPETVAVLRLAEDIHQQSAGLFDVTIGRQLVASGFLPRVGGAPLTRYTGDATHIQIIDNTHVRTHRSVLIDLGGIAKGHAVDLAVRAMRAGGAAHGIVNAGGDLRVFGPESERIWLRGADGALRSAFDVCETAVASSSNLLFRRSLRGAAQTPHIGRGRKAVVTDQAVTVLAPLCAVADALTKIAIVDIALAERLLAGVGGAVLTVPPQRPATQLLAA